MCGGGDRECGERGLGANMRFYKLNELAGRSQWR